MNKIWTSLVVQWIGIHLPVLETVRSLVWEDSTCWGAPKFMHHDDWAHMLQLLKPSHLEPVQQQKPLRWEASAPQWRVALACHNWRKLGCSNEDPLQPKIKTAKKKKKKGSPVMSKLTQKFFFHIQQFIFDLQTFPYMDKQLLMIRHHIF